MAALGLEATCTCLVCDRFHARAQVVDVVCSDVGQPQGMDIVHAVSSGSSTRTIRNRLSTDWACMLHAENMLENYPRCFAFLPALGLIASQGSPHHACTTFALPYDTTHACVSWKIARYSI